MLTFVRKPLGALDAPWLFALANLSVFGPVAGRAINVPDTSTYIFVESAEAMRPC